MQWKLVFLCCSMNSVDVSQTHPTSCCVLYSQTRSCRRKWHTLGGVWRCTKQKLCEIEQSTCDKQLTVKRYRITVSFFLWSQAWNSTQILGSSKNWKEIAAIAWKNSKSLDEQCLCHGNWCFSVVQWTSVDVGQTHLTSCWLLYSQTRSCRRKWHTLRRVWRCTKQKLHEIEQSTDDK